MKLSSLRLNTINAILLLSDKSLEIQLNVIRDIMDGKITKDSYSIESNNFLNFWSGMRNKYSPEQFKQEYYTLHMIKEVIGTDNIDVSEKAVIIKHLLQFSKKGLKL